MPFNFKYKILALITGASILLASISGFLFFKMSVDLAIKNIAGITQESVNNLTQNNGPLDGAFVIEPETAKKILNNLVIYGIFSSLEIYDSNFHEIAELEDANLLNEPEESHHSHKPLSNALVVMDKSKSNEHIVVVTAPIVSNGKTIGYLEAYRKIPQWRMHQITQESLVQAFVVAISIFSLGLLLYPILLKLNSENRNKSQEILTSYVFLIDALSRAIGKKDSDTQIHSQRVTLIAVRLAKELTLSKSEIASIIIGGLLHDIGKIAVPDDILLKPGKLTNAEMAIMKTHVMEGEEIIGHNPWLSIAKAIISGHHEKWNGSGYPRGLKEEQIPRIARLFTIADIFDSLCSERKYKNANSLEEALAIMDHDAPHVYDPSIYKCFRRIAPQLHAEFLSMSIESLHDSLSKLISTYIHLDNLPHFD